MTATPIGYTTVSFQIGVNTSTQTFLIMKKLPYQCILGTDYMKKHRIWLYLHENQLIYDHDVTNPIKTIPSNEPTALINILSDAVHPQIVQTPNNREKGMSTTLPVVLNHEAMTHIPPPPEKPPITNPSPIIPPNSDTKPDSELSPEAIQQRVQSILDQYPTVARKDGKFGQTDFTLHQIETTGPPPKLKPYRYSPKLTEEIRDQVQDLIRTGMARPSKSPYAAPVVMAKKKSGKWRMCINYIALNQQTKSNAGPMANCNTILRSIPPNYWYSVIDLKSGFWQIKLHPDSIEKSAFCTTEGHYEMTVMPFGLKNAPKTFHYLMNQVLKGYIGKFVDVFVDDILIWSKTLEEHLRHIEMVLERLKEANLTISGDKSDFAKREVKILGHVATQHGLKTDPDKIQAIVLFPPLKSKHDIHRFHGMCQWYATFIKDFATKAEPLYRLLRKQSRWHWGPDQEEAFQQLKRDIADAVCLYGLDYDHPILVKCDASHVGLGAVLCQNIDGIERPIMFASKSLKQSERSSHIYEKELYAMIFAYRKFCEFIQGHKFTIQTDNRALSYLNRNKQRMKLNNWATEINSWDADIIFRPGKENVVADALSRAPIPIQPNDPDMFDEPNDIMYTPLAALAYCTTTLSELQIQQRNDKDLMKIISDLTNAPVGLITQQPDSVIQNNILKKYITSFQSSNLQTEFLFQISDISPVCLHSRQCNTANKTQSSAPLPNTSQRRNHKYPVPVIPTSMKLQIMSLFHDSPEAGHLGVKKTLVRIKSRCYWNNMNKEIRQYIHTCEICQKVKPATHLPYGYMESAPPPSKVFDCIHIDFMGPFPTSSGGKLNKYLFVVIDELSKWVELFPIRVATAKKVAEILENEVRYGVPSTIVSDSGSQFISNTMQKLAKTWQIKLKYVSPYHPQPNQSERANRNLKSMMQAYINDNHHSWYKHMQHLHVALALRTSINNSTQVAPSILNLGRIIPLPFDRVLDDCNGHVTPSPQPNILPAKLNEVISFVRQNIIEAQKRNKHYYDLSHIQHPFKEGDYVLLTNHQLSNKEEGIMQKLTPRFVGPYQLGRQLTPITFEVISLPECKHIGKRHVNDLRMFYVRPGFNVSTLKSPQVQPDGQLTPQPRVLRQRQRVNYRTLAGYHTRK
jgi:hypothetical protein